MAASAVEICNDALIILGAEKISSLSDDTRVAILCNEEYEKVRDQLLYSHPWNFAIKQDTWAPDADVPTGHWEFTYAFSLPSDCLRIWKVDCESEWRIHGRKLMANSDVVYVEYIKKETDTTLFTPGFSEALAHKLASRISYSVNQSATFSEGVDKKAEEILRNARSYDAQEAYQDRVFADDFLKARY